MPLSLERVAGARDLGKTFLKKGYSPNPFPKTFNRFAVKGEGNQNRIKTAETYTRFSSLYYFRNEVFASPTAFQSAAAHSCAF